jgi:hypothetical protein
MDSIASFVNSICELESLEPLRAAARHPLVLIDEAHTNTFNVMKIQEGTPAVLRLIPVIRRGFGDPLPSS